MSSVTKVITAPTMPNLFRQVNEYMGKYPPNAYGTLVIRGGARKVMYREVELDEYWVTVDRFTSCD